MSDVGKPLIDPAEVNVDENVEGSVGIVLLTSVGKTEIKINNKPCVVSVFSDKITITQQTKGNVMEVIMSDVLGAKCASINGSETEFELTIFRYVMTRSWFCSGDKSRQPAHIVLKFSATSAATASDSGPGCCQSWVNLINTLASRNSSPSPLPAVSLLSSTGALFTAPVQRKIIVFVNPHSGPGLSVKIWNQHAKHMMDEANVAITLVETTHANHAHEFISAVPDLLSYAGVATVGGDGILSEVVHGIDARPDAQEVFRQVPLIPIPGGTSNGLVKSLLYESNIDYGIVNSLFLSLKGHVSPIDMTRVVTGSGHRHLSFLMLAWGIISDIDLLSETMRWMGEMRLYVAAVYFVLRNRPYHGRVSILTATDGNASMTEADLPPLSQPIVASTGSGSDSGGGSGSTVAVTADIESGVVTTAATASSAADEPDRQWTVLEGAFSLVLMVNSTHISSSVLSGPNSAVNSGYLDCYIMKKGGLCGLLSLLLSFDSGDYIKDPNIQHYKARAYRLEPADTVQEKGLYSMDGEMIEYGPVQGLVTPGYARIVKG